MSDFEVRLKCSCEEAVQLTTDILTRYGFEVVRTFDLRNALHVQGLPCLCPYHETEACTCNHIVLSVRQAAESGQPVAQPSQIVIQSDQGDTWFSLPASLDSDMLPASQKGISNPRLLRGLVEVLRTVALSW